MKNPTDRMYQAAGLLLMLMFFYLPNGLNAQQAAKITKVNAVYSQQFIDRIEQIKNHPVKALSPRDNELTVILAEAKRNLNTLTTEARMYLQNILNRPTALDKTYESSTGFFKLWYTNTGADAVDQTDSNHNNVPDYVENMAVALETSRAKYAQIGFTLPPPDGSLGGDSKYDVYISSSVSGSAYGMVGPDNYTTDGDNSNSVSIKENTSCTSYMVMRSEYNNMITAEKTLDKVVNVTAAHEFLHAVQMGTSDMSSWVMEMDATWSEDWVFPGVDDNFQYFSTLFQNPDIALDWLNSDATGKPYSDGPFKDHWYATWLMERFFTERKNLNSVDGSFVKDIYNRIVSLITDRNADNRVLQTAAIKAFDDELKVYNGTDMISSIKNFYIACAVMTSNPTFSQYAFKRADDYRKNSDTKLKFENVFTYNGSPLHFDSETNGNKRLMRLGADYFQINANQNFTISVTPKGASAQKDSVVVALLKMNAEINPTILQVVNATRKGDAFKVDVGDQASYSNYVLLVFNDKHNLDTLSTQYTIDVMTLQDGTAIETAESLPTSVKLLNNYPNPFNPSTRIKFELNKSANVELCVYSILGSKVAEIYKGFKNAGSYEMTFNAQNLTSGVYFVRLQTENQLLIQKINLIK